MNRIIKWIYVYLIIINLLLHSSFIYFNFENTLASNNDDFYSDENVVPIINLNSRAGSYIIDLNTEIDAKHQNITIFGANRDDGTGNALAAGDINDDNIEDLIIGTANPYSTAGVVYVTYGRSKPSPVLDLSTSPDITFTGIDNQDLLGRALATGDINGDNIDDIILSASYGDGNNNNKMNCGEVYIIYGNKSLPSTWSLSTTPANVTIYGVDNYDNLGYSIAAGDINGDGFDDVIMGAHGGKGPGNSRVSSSWGCGETYVLFGNSTLPSTVNLSTSANMTIYGREAPDRAGWTVGSCNINDDSYDDIIIGAIHGDGEKNSISNCGEVYVIYGNKTELIPTTLDLLFTPANVTLNGTKFNENLGRYAITSGDVNGDNIDDLILGSHSSRTYIFYGNESYPANLNTSASNASVRIFSARISDFFGYSISTGNINNDSYDDIIIGAYNANGPGDTRLRCGEAYVVNGSKSLPSIINFKTSAPNITIYGAKGYISGIDGGDAAGTAVLMCDYNGDGLDELLVGVPGGNGRVNHRKDSGEVSIILLDGETLPLPYTIKVSLKNGAGDDGKTCYAKYEAYQFEIKIITPNKPDELESVMLHLGYYTSVDKIKMEWFRSTGEFTELNDPNNYVEIDPFSNSNEYKKTWTVNFYIIFDWNYTIIDYQSVQVRTTGNTGLTDWVNLSTGQIYFVENRLNITGDLEVISESQGELSEGDWVPGGEHITWKGVKVVYFDTTDIYPPQNIGIAMTVNDPKGNTWTKMNIPGLILFIKTLTVNETIKDGSYNINIIGIPSFCDVSNINFQLNIDHDNVTFSNVLPPNDSWQSSLVPQCKIQISDLSTNVNASTIQFRYSTDNGLSWTNWTVDGIKKISAGQNINCSVNPVLKEGINNLIQWRAHDIVRNDYNYSVPNQVIVDVSNVTFSNPTPTSETVQNELAVECGITISDQLSGVNASSIEFSTSTTGIWGFDEWQSAKLTKNGPIIQYSVKPVFAEGSENYIRWRAKDMVGNGYHVSESYQIKIKINLPPVNTLISPENYSIIQTLTPELVWEGSDPNNDTELQYDIYLSPVKNFILTLNENALLKEKLNQTRYELEAPLINKVTYYWTVIPHDGITNGSCNSGIWYFKIDTSIEIPKITLLTPANNSNISTGTPKLTWELNYSNSELVTFDIYLKKSINGQDIIDKKNLVKEDYKLTTFIIEAPLTPGETYYWTVIPTAQLADGTLEGTCISKVWNFKVELPKEDIFIIDMNLESQTLSVVQGNYTYTNITIVNLGNSADIVDVSINKGTLNANIGLEYPDTFIKLNKSENITLQVGILVSEDAKPQNYTIYITARSNGAFNIGKIVSITKSLKIEVIKKEIEPDIGEDNGKGQEKTGESNLMLWIAIWVIIILIIVLFLYVYRVNKARKIPYVKSELLYKPPKHLGLLGEGKQKKKDLELPAGEIAIQALGTTPMPTSYQLPEAALTKDQELKLLRERFLMGDITEETYRELKTEIVSSDDVIDVENKEENYLDEQYEETEPFDEELDDEMPEEELKDEIFDQELDQEILEDDALIEEIADENEPFDSEIEPMIDDYKPKEIDFEKEEDEGLVWRPEPEDPETHTKNTKMISDKKKKVRKKVKKEPKNK
jgi:hypothetical protein